MFFVCLNNREREFFFIILFGHWMNHTPSKLFQYQNFYIVIMRENNIQTERLYWFCILRYQKRLNEWSIFVTISWFRMKHALLLVLIQLMFSIPLTLIQHFIIAIVFLWHKTSAHSFCLPIGFLINLLIHVEHTKRYYKHEQRKKYDIMCDFYAFINKKQIYIMDKNRFWFLAIECMKIIFWQWTNVDRGFSHSHFTQTRKKMK